MTKRSVLLASGVLLAVTEGEKIMASVVLFNEEYCDCAKIKERRVSARGRQLIQKESLRIFKVREKR